MRKYGHKSMSDKGSAHPEKIGPGVQTVDKQGGSNPAIPMDFAGGGSESQPAGVKRGDGTEHRGETPKHLHTKNTKVPTARGNDIPSGVRQHSGLKAPKRIK